MLRYFLIIVALLYGIVAPPVTQQKQKPENEEQAPDGLEDYMEYHRYLREVVNTLESDPEFRKKLEKANEEDIRSGKIAHELEFVSHHVRTRLDEIKRTELERLRDLTEKKKELIENNSIDDPTHHHLDQTNQHTFEIEDLKKLIAKTTEDLAEADRKRRDEFKEYELQKEYDKQQKINHTNGEEREKLEKQYMELEEKHKKHEKLHEPGHKQQLEQVWEEQDQMQQEFDPKTFFMLHDLDSNGLWDQTEVKALFVKELDKMYAAGAPEDDMRERAEEMERMRESVFQEVDTNKDGFIDYDEFIVQTKRNDFQQDHGWQGLDERKPYTDEELQEYIREHQAQQLPVHQMPQSVHPGQVPPGYYPPSGHQVVPPMNYHPNDNYGHPHAPVPQAQAQFHPGQLPQVQINPQQLHYNQVPPPQGNPQFQGGQHRGEAYLNTNEVYPNEPPSLKVNEPNVHHANYQNNPNQQQVQQSDNPQQNLDRLQQANIHQQVPNQHLNQQPNIPQNQKELNTQQVHEPNFQQNHANANQANVPINNLNANQHYGVN